MKNPNKSNSAKKMSGLSLVELMIALTIGLIVLGAVIYVYLGSKQVFKTTDNMSRIQENARYALETIARHVRMAGYIGCGNLANVTVNNIANAPRPEVSTGTAILGEDEGGSTTSIGSVNRVAGDLITLTGAFRGGANLNGNLAPSNANVQINGNPQNFVEGEILIVTSCTQADVFRATNVSASGSTVTIAHSNSTNTGNRVGNYTSTDQVSKLEQYTYFIGLNGANKRALYRADRAANPAIVSELVDNVEDMQIEYGIDSNEDAAADIYRSATSVPTADWPKVVSARISLLMASPDNNVVPSTQQYFFNSSTATTATDRRMYQVFTTTIALRNRVS